jgi:hypothetical protein
MDKEKRIRKVAFWLYLLKGKKTGEDLEHWLKAEKFVAQLDGLVTKCIKFIAVVALIVLIIYLINFFVLPYFGYQCSIRKTM